MFTFQLTPIDGAPMPQSGNTARNTGGTFAFGAIDYTQTGVYHYQVSEVNGGEAEYAYDTTVYDVTVTVTDENGQLKATADGAENIAFVNRYTPTPVTLTGETALRAHKTLTGRELNEGEFVFQLKDADGDVVGEAANSADGSVVFADLTFAQAGQYTYTISEKINGVGGITYDQTVYTVQIHVTDEGGYLAADVQYYDGQGAGADNDDQHNVVEAGNHVDKLPAHVRGEGNTQDVFVGNQRLGQIIPRLLGVVPVNLGDNHVVFRCADKQLLIGLG